MANSSGRPPRQRPGDGCCSLMGRLGWRGGGWTPGSLHTPSRQRQPIARAHPESVPRGHRPLARECDAGGGQVQAAVSVSGRYILTNGFSLLQTIQHIDLYKLIGCVLWVCSRHTPLPCWGIVISPLMRRTAWGDVTIPPGSDN